MSSDLTAEYAAWLTDFLPDDYYDRYDDYRWDIDLRRDHQRAAFEAGWLQPTWTREHGGRSLGLGVAHGRGSYPSRAADAGGLEAMNDL